MLIGILARLVDVECVMRMLERRDLQAAAHQQRNELRQQRGLARPAPAHHSKHFRRVHVSDVARPSRSTQARRQEFPISPAVTLIANPRIDALKKNDSTLCAITTLRIEPWAVETSAVWQAAAMVNEK